MVVEIQEEVLPDRMYETFCGKTIMITGGTGFLGKVYIESFLRAFDVAKIYILIRTKKGKEAKERLLEIFKNPLFDKVRNVKGDIIFDKCVAIPGDVTAENLDLSPEDRLVLNEEVNFVIHSAAAVRFNEPLKVAININTKGTYSMLELAKGMKELQLFIHISTAYCHPEEKVLFEKTYRSKHDAMHLLQMIEWFDDSIIDAMSKSLMRGIPNTYVFSKALAEDLVADAMNTLPAIVLRPSIVLPIWKEPIPGWTDSLNGPTGLLIAAGKGVCRSMYGYKEAKADFVSVDVIADVTATIATYTLHEGLEHRVFNLCFGDEVDINWGTFIEITKLVGKEVPFDLMIWAPGGEIRRSKVLHYIMILLVQIIPALCLDGAMWCFGYKPFLWKIQMRLVEGSDILSYYTTNEWTFKTDERVLVKEWLNPRERKTYTVCADGLNFKNYAIHGTLAARRYLLKEPDENLPMAKRRHKIMVCVDRICNVLLKMLLAYLSYKWIFLPICHFL